MENQNQNYQELVDQPFQSIEPEPIIYFDTQLKAEIKWQKFQQQEEMRKAMLPKYYTQGKVESQTIVEKDDSPSCATQVGETIGQLIKVLLLLIIFAILIYINLYFWYY